MGAILCICCVKVADSSDRGILERITYYAVPKRPRARRSALKSSYSNSYYLGKLLRLSKSEKLLKTTNRVRMLAVGGI